MRRAIIFLIAILLVFGCTQTTTPIDTNTQTVADPTDSPYYPDFNNDSLVDTTVEDSANLPIETTNNSDTNDNPIEIVDEPIIADDIVTISIEDTGFTPTKLTIQLGQTVRWVNNSKTAHTVTSDNGTYLRSSNILIGKTYERIFTSKGIFAYHSEFGGLHKGSVTVE